MREVFVPTQTFEATVNGRLNRYKQGQQYIVYDTPQHKELEGKVKKWAEEGKVQIVGTSNARPTVVKMGG